MQHPPRAKAVAAVAGAWDRQAPEPFAPMLLTPAARAGLMGLRVLLGAITAMAAFTFIHGLHG